MLQVPVKPADKLARQRHAGALLASVFDILHMTNVPGISTMETITWPESLVSNTDRPAR